MWLVFKHCYQVWWWSIQKYSSYRADKVNFGNLANSRAITPMCLMGSGWLSNLAEIVCQQTFSQSLMIIQWKLFKLLSGQMLWLPPANRRMCSHNSSSFFKRAYKKQCTENVLDALKALQSLRESVVFNKHFCSFL